MAGGLPPEIPIAIDLTPYLQVLTLIPDVLEWLGVIPDPLQELISLFTGRPREQATEQVIARLYQSPNAAARLWGVELSRLLTQDDIVISSGGGAQTILGAINQQFENNLIAQGVSAQRAGEIAVNAVSRAAQAGAPLEPELQQPLPQGFSITGPQSVLDTYNQGLAQGQQLGKTGTALTNYAERFVYQNAPFSALAQIGFSSNPQTAPPPSPVSPGQPDQPVSPAQPTPPPSPTPPATTPCPPFTALPDCLPTPPAADPDLDEVGNGFAAGNYWSMVLAIYAMNIFEALNAPGTEIDPVTCTQLSGLFSNLTNALALITAQLQAIASAIGANAAAPTPIEAPPPSPVSTPTPEPTPPTEDCICEALNAPLPPYPDPRAKLYATINQLAAEGAFDASLAQVITNAT